MLKPLKPVISLAICLCIVLLSAPVQASGQTLTISTAEEFLAFGENCRLDTYSQGLVVSLDADIDLSGRDFEPVPIFSGTFQGNGHTISGLNITAEGSDIGLFRYLTAEAAISTLYVEGTVQPGGSRSNVGGIAGVNAGQILSCRFTGTVTGADRVGGIAGINTVTGIIDHGSVSGSISGNHFSGGIAGENAGVIRYLANEAGVNETVQENSVAISDITLDTLTDSEAANTVTDIGGIAGTNSGVIRHCLNQGTVGYPHMGYNVGGIAGSQSGYIIQCENEGAVSGRKEVGGITGQMEPVTHIDFSTDTLQQLQAQLDQVSGLANTAASNAQANTSNIKDQLGLLQQHTDTARDAVDSLLPDSEDPQLPDQDTVAAAQSSLSSSLSAIPGTMQSITTATESTATTLSQDLQALAEGINAMGQTLNNASENLGGSVADVSDADTPEDLTGKVEGCVNRGAILADLNGGGITGAMALENDLDPEADVQLSGSVSLNSDTQLRCVILTSSNEAAVTVKKSYAGGIVGWQSMGLVKSCTNLGALDAAAADNVGGIAGSSGGYIRDCKVKSSISGSAAVGGIAGSAAVVSDCRSMTALQGREQVGAVIGIREDSYMDAEAPVTGNYYVATGRDIGGIDGISYAGCAQSLDLAEFLALENISEAFRTATVSFVLEDSSVMTVAVSTGEALRPEDIPALPEKAGYTGSWEGLADADLSAVYFDTAFRAVYTALDVTIQSDMTRSSGLPVMLAQGQFLEDSSFQLTDAAIAGSIESWNILPSQGSTVQKLRWLLPEGYDAKHLTVQICSADGVWRTAEFTSAGSYIVFSVAADDISVALFAAEKDDTMLIVAAVTAAVILAGGTVLTVLLVKRKRKALSR